MVCLRSSQKVRVSGPGELRGDRWEQMNSERKQRGEGRRAFTSSLQGQGETETGLGQGAVSRRDLTLTPCAPLPASPLLAQAPLAPAFQTVTRFICLTRCVFFLSQGTACFILKT